MDGAEEKASTTTTTTTTTTDAVQGGGDVDDDVVVATTVAKFVGERMNPLKQEQKDEGGEEQAKEEEKETTTPASMPAETEEPGGERLRAEEKLEELRSLPPESPRRSIELGEWSVDFTQRIGRGSYATVWKATSARTGGDGGAAVAAVKEVMLSQLSDKLVESLESEVNILKKVTHVNIVSLFDIYKRPDKLYLVLEYCGGGDLSSFLRRNGRLKEATVKRFMSQLSSGLGAMRQLSLVHRDLKPQNLLLTSRSGDEAVLKIGDFGFARYIQPHGMAETLCGSPLYMAPEILKMNKYDAKADLWSVGAIMFEMLAGRPPFAGNNHLELLRNIEKSGQGGGWQLPSRISYACSTKCKALLRGLLQRKPVSRISYEELFAHPFLEMCDSAVTPRRPSSSSSPPPRPPASASVTPRQTAVGTEIESPFLPTAVTAAAVRGQPASDTPARDQESGAHAPLQPQSTAATLAAPRRDEGVDAVAALRRDMDQGPEHNVAPKWIEVEEDETRVPRIAALSEATTADAGVPRADAGRVPSTPGVLDRFRGISLTTRAAEPGASARSSARNPDDTHGGDDDDSGSNTQLLHRDWSTELLGDYVVVDEDFDESKNEIAGDLTKVDAPVSSVLGFPAALSVPDDGDGSSADTAIDGFGQKSAERMSQRTTVTLESGGPNPAAAAPSVLASAMAVTVEKSIPAEGASPLGPGGVTSSWKGKEHDTAADEATVARIVALESAGVALSEAVVPSTTRNSISTVHAELSLSLLAAEIINAAMALARHLPHGQGEPRRRRLRADLEAALNRARAAGRTLAASEEVLNASILPNVVAVAYDAALGFVRQGAVEELVGGEKRNTGTTAGKAAAPSANTSYARAAAILRVLRDEAPSLPLAPPFRPDDNDRAVLSRLTRTLLGG